MTRTVSRILQTQKNLIAFLTDEFKQKTLPYAPLVAIFCLCLTPTPGTSRGVDSRDKDQEKTKDESFKKSIWEQAMAQDANEWSEELKKELLRLKPDSSIEEIAEQIRKRQIHARIQEAVDNGEITREEGKERLDQLAPPDKRPNNPDKDSEIETFRRGVLARAKMQDPGEWSDELKAAIVRAGWEIKEIAEKFHGEKSKTNHKNVENEKMQKFREGILVRAMAQSPDEWSGDLRDAIKKARWNIKELEAKISKYQEEKRSGTRSKSTDLTLLMLDLNTPIEIHSWGRIKRERIP